MQFTFALFQAEIGMIPGLFLEDVQQGACKLKL